MCLISYANSKGADQPSHPCSLISPFVVRCLDSIISLDSIAEISRLWLASVAAQAGLSLPLWETPKDMFCRVVAVMFLYKNHKCLCISAPVFFEWIKLVEEKHNMLCTTLHLTFFWNLFNKFTITLALISDPLLSVPVKAWNWSCMLNCFLHEIPDRNFREPDLE